MAEFVGWELMRKCAFHKRKFT